MEIERCSSPACRRPYEIAEIGVGAPGAKESEEIQCPYCRNITTRRSTGAFLTHPLSAERRAAYNAEHPL